MNGIIEVFTSSKCNPVVGSSGSNKSVLPVCFWKVPWRVLSAGLHPTQCGRLLPQCIITQAHILQGLDFIVDFRNRLRRTHRFIYGHFNTSEIDFPLYRTSKVSRLKRLPLQVSPMHIHIWEEIHFNNFQTSTTTGFAASAFTLKEKRPAL